MRRQGLLETEGAVFLGKEKKRRGYFQTSKFRE
jgi:hypothetical protein